MNLEESWKNNSQKWIDGGCLCIECGHKMHIKKKEGWFYCDNCGMVQNYHFPFYSLRQAPKSVTKAANVTETSVTEQKPKCAVCGAVLKGRLGKKTCSTKCRKRFSRGK